MMILDLLLYFIVPVLFFDFFYFGFIPEKFCVWPSFVEYDKEKVLMKDAYVSAKTDKKGKFIDRYINSRKGFRNITVTENHMFFKNTNRTYILKIPIDTLASYDIEEKSFMKNIKIVDVNGDVTRLHPRDLDKWGNLLNSLGLKHS